MSEKNEKRKARLGKKLSKQLILASETMIDYFDACCACGDPVRIEGDDARLILSSQMFAFGNLMRSIYEVSNEH